jgi:hypothetical protein
MGAAVGGGRLRLPGGSVESAQLLTYTLASDWVRPPPRAPPCDRVRGLKSLNLKV